MHDCIFLRKLQTVSVVIKNTAINMEAHPFSSCLSGHSKGGGEEKVVEYKVEVSTYVTIVI